MAANAGARDAADVLVRLVQEVEARVGEGGREVVGAGLGGVDNVLQWGGRGGGGGGGSKQSVGS